jgi:phycoerythrin-associated linker protein
MVGFSHMLTLLRGAASSDKAPIDRHRARLNTALMSNRPSQIRPVVGATVTATFSDVSAILAKLFKPKDLPVLPQPEVPASDPTALALAQQVREQAQKIAMLQQQLANLSSFAAIGTAYLSDWQSPTVGESVISQLDSQMTQIVKLEAQIADARRYASIGESRLNKWRGRVFNS